MKTRSRRQAGQRMPLLEHTYMYTRTYVHMYAGTDGWTHENMGKNMKKL